jgi:exonuclease VII large subunit
VDLAQRIRRGLVQKLFNQEQSLQEIHHRLLRGMILKLDALDQTCSALIQQASVLDIQSVLQRGFSVARVNGKVLRSIKDGMPGELLETLMSDGTVNSRIESTALVVLARPRHMES